MKTHTQEFKEEIKLLGKQQDVKITYTLANKQIELTSEDINSVTPHYEGNLLKSVMKQLDIESNKSIPEGTEINFKYGLLVNGEYEYLNYGNYIVYSSEKQEDTNSYIITCYDKLINSMKDYEKLDITYPVTVREYITKLAEKLGLEFRNKEDTFVNYDKELTVDFFEVIGFTYRDVLDDLAEVTASVICLDNEDKLELRDINDLVKTKTETGETLQITDSIGNLSIIPNGNSRQDFYLPDEYTQLEYIESTGTQYIDTGITAKDNIDFDIKCSFNSYTADTFVIGSRGSNNVINSLYFGIGWGGSNYVLAIGNYLNQITKISPLYNEVLNISYKSTNNKIIINNNEIEITKGTFSNEGLNITIGARNTTTGITNYFKGKIYSCKILDNEELVREFIPCKRNADNVIGLYDVVNKTFYTNQGTGTFVAGTEQKVSPEYPSIVETVGSNINLLNILDIEESEKNGISYSVKNGILKLNGTATEGLQIDLGSNITIKKGTYTHSCNYIQQGLYISFDNLNTTVLSGNILKTTFDLTEDKTYSKYFLWINKGTILNAVEIKLKLEKGTKATPYSPYNQGSVEIDVSNKQLLDKTTMTFKKMFLNYDSTAKVNYKLISAGSEDYICYIIPIRNKTITISSNVEGNRHIVCGFENYPVVNMEADQFFSSSSINGTFTANENINYIVLFVCNDGIEPTDVLVEYGETKSNYVEHQSQSKIVPIQEEMLEDDYIDDVEYHTWGKNILTGDESIAYYNAPNETIANTLDTAYFQIKAIQTPETDGAKGHAKSNMFQSTISGAKMWGSGVSTDLLKEGVGSDRFIIIRINKSRLIGWNNNLTSTEKVNLLKTWLQEKYNSGNPVVVYYKLAIPKSLPLTEEQKEVMNELNNIVPYKEVTNIYSNDTLSPIFDVTYAYERETIDEEYLKDTNVSFVETFGPINSVVLSRSSSDNIYRKDDESIAKNGLCEIKISDNQIMNNNDRDQYIDGIFNKLKGLTYPICDFTSTGIMYFDLLDKFDVKVGDNIYPVVMFNNEQDITQGLEEQIYADKPETSETDYTKADKTDQKINQINLIVDKQNQTIQGLISQSTEFEDKLVKLEANVDGISQKVENMADLTRETSGIKSIILENCVAGSLLELNILGNNTVFDYLYPADDLYPSDDLYPYGDSRIVVINYPTGSEEGTLTGIYELGITEVLRQNGSVYDEYVLENGEAKIIRRINQDGTIKTTEEIEELGQFAIDLLEGTNDIEIQNYTANLSAKYVIKSDYTDIFATKVEMNSKITQTAEEINFEVSKKVGEDEVISKINQSAEQISILANKLNLNGAITANGNFKIDKDGNMECKNAVFNGGNITINNDASTYNNAQLKCNSSDSKSYMSSTTLELYNNDFTRGVGLSIDGIQGGRQILAYSESGSVGIGYGEIYADGNIYGANISSDKRLKENIKDANINSLEILKKIVIKEFDWKKTKKHINAGFIAQDMEKIDENFVLKKEIKNKDGKIIDYKYYINELPIIATLTKAIQEQQEQIEQLKQEIEKLKKGEK